MTTSTHEISARTATPHRAVLVVTCLALAAVVSAVASLNVAIPSIARDTHASQTELSWIIDAYALVFAALLLPGGALGDRYGRRRMYAIGLLVYGAGSLAAMAYADASWLIGMRAVLGLGAALVMPATLSTITSTFPAEQRARAVGAWAGVAGASAILGLLTSGDPSAVLNQASLLLQVEGTHNAMANQFLGLARQLNTIKEQRQRTAAGVAQIQAQFGTQKQSIGKLLATQKSLLNTLTAEQQQQVAASTVGGSTTSPSTTTTPVTYTGPTNTQAGKAVAYAFAQIGKPYVWGATGPDSFDCSGLMEAAWSAAGVSIPRTTYEEWASLPHIPMSDLQPGDMILYNGESHVAMYVGNGMIIDAPHTGAVVEEIPRSTDWYAQGEDGAVRP